ncbi:hypothetical protein [Methylobacter svalbardensis]|uniref:hypothetical protein n=1 Tax=Methylobacter svalbardensis TaxID=3080016 RepID=UPI0030ED4A10
MLLSEASWTCGIFDITRHQYSPRRQLNNKMEWDGGILLAVPPSSHNTSRTCRYCGYISKNTSKVPLRRLRVRKLRRCSRYDQRVRVGYRLLAYRESVQSGRSVKQKPAGSDSSKSLLESLPESLAFSQNMMSEKLILKKTLFVIN